MYRTIMTFRWVNLATHATGRKEVACRDSSEGLHLILQWNKLGGDGVNHLWVYAPLNFREELRNDNELYEQIDLA